MDAETNNTQLTRIWEDMDLWSENFLIFLDDFGYRAQLVRAQTYKERRTILNTAKTIFEVGISGPITEAT